MRFKTHLKLLIFLLLFIASCGEPSQTIDHSDIKQLTQTEYACFDHGEERIQYVRERLPNAMIRDFAQDEQRLFELFAGIPDPYIDYLIQAHQNTGFYIQRTPGRNGGVTEFSKIYPNWVKVGSGQMVDFAFQHEVGHALTPYFGYWNDKSRGQFDSMLETEGKAHQNNPKMHSYPRSYINSDYDVYLLEYFAEAFNSYYCSPESNDALNNNFNSTHTLLTNIAEPPIWEDKSKQTENSVFLALIPSDREGEYAFAINTKNTNLQLCMGEKQICLNNSNNALYFDISESIDIDDNTFSIIRMNESELKQSDIHLVKRMDDSHNFSSVLSLSLE